MTTTEQIKDTIGSAAGKARSVVRDAVMKAKGAARSAVDKAKGVAHDAVGKARGVAHDAVDKAKGVAHDAVDKARDVARSGASKVHGKAAAAPVTDRTLVIDREIAATPYQVFKAWTDPGALATWWGPEGFTLEDYRIDVEPSGHYRVKIVSPTGESHISSGVFRELVHNERVTFTFAWEHDGKRGHETEVTVTIAPAGKATRMHFVQDGFESAGQRDSHNQGWASSFNKLERMLTSA